MTRNDIDRGVKDIMMTDGPDGHIDGHDIITDYILKLLNAMFNQAAFIHPDMVFTDSFDECLKNMVIYEDRKNKL